MRELSTHPGSKTLLLVLRLLNALHAEGVSDSDIDYLIGRPDLIERLRKSISKAQTPRAA